MFWTNALKAFSIEWIFLNWIIQIFQSFMLAIIIQNNDKWPRETYPELKFGPIFEILDT